MSINRILYSRNIQLERKWFVLQRVFKHYIHSIEGRLMRTKLQYLLSFILMITLVGNLMSQGVDPGTKNLTHSWTFDDGTANDYVGHANGTLKGNATISGGSLVISSQGQWMEMPGDVINLHAYNEITLEAWYTPTKNANPNFTMLAYFG